MLLSRCAPALMRQRSTRSFVSSILLSRSSADWLAEPTAKLRDECKKRGLSFNGKKQTLVSRLLKADAEAAPAPRPSNAPSSTTHVIQQTRAVSWTAPARAADPHDKFRPRSRTLDIKMPDMLEEDEEGPNIPSLPDNFNSKTSESASPTQEAPSNTPKVLTVASAATHISGGPSHNLFASTDAHAEEIAAEDAEQEIIATKEKAEKAAESAWETVKTAIGWDKLFGEGVDKKVMETAVERPKQAADTVMARLPDIQEYVAIPEVTAGGEVPGDASRKMNSEEGRGVWILLGLVTSGWLLGGVLAPPKKEHEH